MDEAQDLEGEWEDLINLLHKKGPNNFLWVFYDDNQRVRYTKPPRAEHVYHLECVIRNTRKVFAETQRYYTSGRSARVAHGIIGPDVEWVDELSSKDLEDLTNGRVSSLIRGLIKEAVEDLKTG